MQVSTLWSLGYYWDAIERKFILGVNSRCRRRTDTTKKDTKPDKTVTSESIETGLKIEYEGDVTYEVIKEGQRLDTGEHHMYEVINHPVHSATLTFQQNVAYERVSLKPNSQTIDVKEMKKLPVTFELETNVAYATKN